MKRKTCLILITVLAISLFGYFGQRQVAAYEIEQQIEEKISCNATLQDNFEDDTVIVVLNKQATFEL